jgi:hypothetical protein
VAAQKVRNLTPGTAVEVDTNALTFPASFSAIPAGNYEAQAVLDVDHSYNYSERVPKDWISDVV